MADSQYTELQGNGALLKAVEYLRMLPEWRKRPAKLREGYCTYAEVVCRHLLSIYAQLEGRPLSEMVELSESIDPISEERGAVAKLEELSTSSQQYERQLNHWHMELAILQKGIEHFFIYLDTDEGPGSIGHILNSRLQQLVENCPWPSGGTAAS